MLEILQAPNYVAAFKLSNDVTAQDYDRMTSETEARLKIHPRIAVYAELTQPWRFTPGAVVRGLRYAFARSDEWTRFARIAIVMEKSSLRALCRGLRVIAPSLEPRMFGSRERDAALTWVTELRPDEPQEPALRLIATTRPDTYAYAWNGKVTRSDIDHVLGVLRTELESHMSVRLLGRIENLEGIEIPALLRSALFRVKLLGLRKIERYAVVGGPGWLERYVGIARKVSGVDLRYFARDREAEAWSWIEAQAVPIAESAGGQAAAVRNANARGGSPLNYD